MTTYVEIVPASRSLLPPLCRQCVWWQRSARSLHTQDEGAREVWIDRVCREWGSCGMAAVQGSECLGVVQFAPVRLLVRAQDMLARGMLAASPDAVLLFCLRLRAGRPAEEARLLLHRGLSSLHERGAAEVFAFARPLGSSRLHGSDNVFGSEFLLANGFHQAGKVGRVEVMRCDLRGLLPVLSDLVWAWRWARHSTPTPTPV